MKLRIALVDETQMVNEMIQESLEAAGHEVVARLSPDKELLSHVRETLPDMMVINVKIPDHNFLQNIADVNREQPMPVVLFTEVDSQELVDGIVQCGVSAYVVDGLEANRLEPIINVARARFTHMQGLRKELANTKQALDERKKIDRAKGIIMERRDCNEDEAYRALRKVAMDKNQRIADVAEGIISAAEVFG